MAVRRINPDMAYGIGDDLIPLAPLPIIAKRDPGTNDLAQLGTTWINEVSGAVWVLTKIASLSATWATSPILSGSGTFTDLTTTGAGGLTVSGAGGISVGAGAFSVDSSGNVVANDLSVSGVFTFTGDLNLTSAALIDLTSTLNASPSISLTANGGANEQILLHSVQGTTATSIDIVSDLGGVHIEGNANSSSAIVLDAANAAGGVTVSAGTNGIGLTAVNGAIALSSGTGAINIGTDAAAHTITLGNSTGATSLVLNAGTGAINVGTNAIAHAITLGNSTGATSIALNVGTGALDLGTNAIAHIVTIGNVTGATAVNINAGSGGFSVLTTNSALSLSSGTGVLNISADGAATTVNIATAAAVKTLTLGSVTGASVSTLRAGSGGLNLTAANGAVVMTSGTGALSISDDAAATVVRVGTGAAAKTVALGSTNTTSTTTLQGGTGGVVVSAPFLALPGPIYIYTGAGAPGNPLALHIGDLYINSTAASAVTRMYIATGVGAWTNITCAA